MRRAAGTLAVVLALVVGASAARAQGGGALAPYFRVEWEVAKSRRGQPLMSGYLYNDYGLPAVRVQLLVEVLDASGGSLGESVAYVDRPVPPFGRAYFEATLPRAGAAYRVSVSYFEWQMMGSGG